MNSDTKKKIVAALGGVMQYLAEEKGQVLSRQAVQIPQNFSPAWTSYGRQTTMMNAQMMQRRVVRR